jgi:hypothetical protein
MECVACGKRIKNESVYIGDNGTFYEGKTLCDSCYLEYLILLSFTVKMSILML